MQTGLVTSSRCSRWTEAVLQILSMLRTRGVLSMHPWGPVIRTTWLIGKPSAGLQAPQRVQVRFSYRPSFVSSSEGLVAKVARKIQNPFSECDPRQKERSNDGEKATGQLFLESSLTETL